MTTNIAPRMSSSVIAKLPGSGTALAAASTLVSDEKLVRLVEPSRFTRTVNAMPSTRSLVRAGLVAPGSENMLKPNELPDDEVPSGELRAGPYKLTSNFRTVPNVNPSK